MEKTPEFKVGWRAGMAEAIRLCHATGTMSLSLNYADNQPYGSMSEVFAVTECIRAITEAVDRKSDGKSDG